MHDEVFETESNKKLDKIRNNGFISKILAITANNNLIYFIRISVLGH